MDWTQVFTIIGSLGAFTYWLHSQMEKRLDKVDERFNRVDADLKSLSDKIGQLDTRISRMEGVLSVRENWWEHHHRDSAEG